MYPLTEQLVKNFYGSLFDEVEVFINGRHFLFFTAVEKSTRKKIFIVVAEHKEDCKLLMAAYKGLYNLSHNNLLPAPKPEELSDDRLCIDFPFYTTNFRDFLNTNPSKSSILNVLCQIADLLLYLKKKHVVHYDIRSSNIIMKNQTPLLTGFYYMDRIGSQLIKNKKKDIPSYLFSPELLKLQGASYPHDAWCFGVLCWEALEPDTFSKFNERNYLINLRKGIFCHDIAGNSKKARFFRAIFDMDPSTRMSVEEMVMCPLFASARAEYTAIKRQKTCY